MAILQPAVPTTYTLQTEVASRVMHMTRDVIDNGNGSVSVNFGARIFPQQITYELDSNNNKIGIYDSTPLADFSLSFNDLMSLFGIRCTLADGTIILLGELLSNFADQIIQNQTGFTGTIDTQSVNIDAVLAAQTPPPIVISGNAGIGGVTLSWTDGTAQTATAGSDGAYSFTVSTNWSGTITPTLTGYTFTPINITYTTLTTDQIAQNYIATIIPPTTITISGSVEIAGATVSDGTNTTISDTSGNYTLTEPENWSGTITPTLTGYIFTPANIVYTNLTTNQTGQVFTPTAS